MRIDVPARPRGRSGVPGWLVGLPMVAMLAIGMAVPLIGADAFDRFMKARGWRDGEPRQAALMAWVQALRRPAPELPTLRFDVKFKHYQKVLDKRVVALKTGRLHTSNEDFVPGKLRFAGEDMTVKLRLQGDDLEAIRGEKWPIRVHVRSGAHVLGMERFTLRPPRIDGFYDKALAYASLEGIAMVPRYRFVRVIVNGKKLGTVGMEEYLSNELVEANERPPGPIVRIDTASVLPDSATVTQRRAAIANIADLRGARAEVMRASRWAKTPDRKRLAKRATGLLNRFLAGRARASEVFDELATPRFLAAVEGVGAPQLLRWDNLRWYYNPIVDRLEPIAYAADSVVRSDEVGLVRNSPIAERILRDPAMARAFKSAEVKLAKLADMDALRGEHPMALFHKKAAKSRFKRAIGVIGDALPAPPELPTAPTSNVDDAISELRPWALGAGEHVIDRRLRLPPAVKLVIAPGAVLRFLGRGELVTRGAATIGAAGGEAVRLVVGAGASARNPVVLAGAETSLFHVVARSEDLPTGGREALLTLHGGEVRAEGLVVEHAHAESAIAALGCRGAIEKAVVARATGDGVALVHTVGLRVQATVRSARGDGIDVRGGGGLRLDGSEVVEAGDKGVTIGGQAEVRFDDGVRVGKARVCLSIKDGSDVRGSLKASECVGSTIATFTKKARLGAARAKIALAGKPRQTRLVRHGDTQLVVDGQEAPKTPGSLEQLYKLGWLGAP